MGAISRAETTNLSANLTEALLDIGHTDPVDVANYVLITLIYRSADGFYTCPLCYAEAADVPAHVRTEHRS